jgi:hypothetical protein
MEITILSTVIRFSARDAAKAWAVLVRHSPGMAQPDRTFVVSEEAARALRKAGIRFKELSREAGVSGAASGEFEQEEILVVERDVETL